MAHRKSNWYDEDDLDDGYSDDDYDDDYWGEEEEYQEDDGNAQDISTGARVVVCWYRWNDVLSLMW